jgi:hypothetical protein
MLIVSRYSKKLPLSSTHHTLRGYEPAIVGLCSIGHFPSLAKPPSRLKTQDSCRSLQKFRATEIFIIPNLLYITIKLDKLPFYYFTLLFFRCKMPCRANGLEAHRLTLTGSLQYWPGSVTFRAWGLLRGSGVTQLS